MTITVEEINGLKISFNPQIDPETETKERVLAAYERNKDFFGFSLLSKHVIHIVYTRQEMNNLLKMETTEWLVGSATQDGTIYIFSPKVFSEVSNHPASNFDPILTHELAHIFTNEISKFGQPVWLREGVAGHVAEQFKNKTPKKIADFERLHNKDDWGGNPNYAQATLFTTFLIEKFGKEQFLRFLEKLSANEEARQTFTAFTKFFKNNFDTDFQQTSQEWQKSAIPTKIVVLANDGPR